MIADNVSEPALTELAVPVVFVPREDSILRFCIDYRKLNAVPKRDYYPIPRMDEYIDSLGDATVISMLDAKSGYWQIEIDDEKKVRMYSHPTMVYIASNV